MTYAITDALQLYYSLRDRYIYRYVYTYLCNNTTIKLHLMDSHFTWREREREREKKNVCERERKKKREKKKRKKKLCGVNGRWKRALSVDYFLLTRTPVSLLISSAISRGSPCGVRRYHRLLLRSTKTTCPAKHAIYQQCLLLEGTVRGAAGVSSAWIRTYGSALPAAMSVYLCSVRLPRPPW